MQVDGFERTNKLRDALALFSPIAALRGSRITAYASAPFYWKLNHGVAQIEEDMRALILGAGMVIKEPVHLGGTTGTNPKQGQWLDFVASPLPRRLARALGSNSLR